MRRTSFPSPECEWAPRQSMGAIKELVQHKSGLVLWHLGSCASRELTREGNQAPWSRLPE